MGIIVLCIVWSENLPLIFQHLDTFFERELSELIENVSRNQHANGQFWNGHGTKRKYYQPSNICSFPSWKHQNCTGPWLKWQERNLLHMTFIGFALAVLDDVCSSLAVCKSVLECANIILSRIKRSNCSQMASCTFGSHWASSVKLWLFQRTEWSTKLMCSVAQDVKCAIFVEDSKALE